MKSLDLEEHNSTTEADKQEVAWMDPTPTIEAVHGHTLIEMLAEKHREDLFVAECKNGPTHTASHRRLDAWAMKRSWVNWRAYGYEIKHSRGDFRRDEKWRDYLPLCTDFYFVAPKGLLKKDEIPPEAGLMEPWGSRLIVVKKAPVRDTPLHDGLATYVLMCRVVVKEERTLDRIAYWKEWLEEKAERQTVGHMVARQMRVRYEREVEAVRSENYRLREESNCLKMIAEHAKSLGLDTDQLTSWNSAREYRRAIGADVLHELREAASKLDAWLACECARCTPA